MTLSRYGLIKINNSDFAPDAEKLYSKSKRYSASATYGRVPIILILYVPIVVLTFPKTSIS